MKVEVTARTGISASEHQPLCRDLHIVQLALWHPAAPTCCSVRVVEARDSKKAIRGSSADKFVGVEAKESYPFKGRRRWAQKQDPAVSSTHKMTEASNAVPFKLLNDIECICDTKIASGLIKGYLTHMLLKLCVYLIINLHYCAVD